MIEGLDPDDGGDQREAAEGEPPEPPPARESEMGLEDGPTVIASIDHEPGLEVDHEDVAWLTARLEDAIPVARPTIGDQRVRRVSARIVGDESMSEAHRRWCDLDGTTDVLTFHSRESDGLHIDLMVCIDEARRRASEFGHDIRRELLLYAVHGLLHCLGHDDHEAEAYDRMHEEEDRVLREIGVGPVFRPEDAS